MLTRFIAMAGLSLAALTAQAQDLSAVGGTYITAGESHYEDGTIVLEPWGPGLNMTATLIKGDHAFETEAYLEPYGSNQFRGSGWITVRYDDNSGCRHRFGVRIFVEGDQLFLRENTPRTIPYNPNGPCTGAGPYIWFNHPEPYVLD